MWPPFSGLAQDFLQHLGDSAEFRKKLSFLMPFVRWMSEPFLFPLETDGSPDQQAREVEKVFRLMTDLRAQGFTVSLNNVGDASLSPEEARTYRAYYLFLIRAFAASKDAEELNLSLKLSALTHDLNAALDPGKAGKTKRWEIIDALAELLTTAAQGRPSPVWDNKPSTDANFEALSACLLLNLDRVIPAFATHNLRSQAHAMALAEAYNLPQNTARIQMLYGMGDPIKRVVATMGRPLLEYVPAGSLARGLKYAGRRFNELASSDNALARTLLSDFSGVNGSAPAFVGEEDVEDSKEVRSLLERSLSGLHLPFLYPFTVAG